jgi:hypothetical protein
MGQAGEIVWKVARGIADIGERLDYLRSAIGHLREKASDSAYRIPPFDFRTFIESEHLLDKSGSMWPEVMRCGAELNSGRYTESVLTGGIGVGKSYLAICTQAYQLYVLTCMHNPHETFGVDAASDITIIFQSINKELAKDVDYSTFRAMIDDSPYFRVNAPYDQGRKSDMRFTRFRIVVKPVSGADTAAIGQNVIGGILDEVNFQQVTEKSTKSKDGGLHDQAVRNYNSIARRRESRFMQMGALPGMLCLVSSRNYPGQFTDRKEAEARGQHRRQGYTTIYVYDKVQWDLRPERFCGDWFHVFIGDETRKPRILNEGEDVATADRRLVRAIPVEFHSQFETDLLASLRDIAGVATQALHPFMINTEAVAKCFGRVDSIASRDDCDFLGTKLQLYPKRIQNPQQLRFAHIDLAISKDSAGVCIGHVPRFVDVKRGDYAETLPIVQFDMILEVRPPRGGEIEFENIRKLIYMLRDNLHVPIKWATFDNFQSKDSMQIMHQQGFMTGYQSMDIDTYAYDVSKQAFYDDRVRAPAHPKAQREMITLEIDPKKNKIDHPPNGSKDVSDAMAGVIFGLTMRREVWVSHQVPTHRIPQSLFDAKPTGAARPQTRNSLGYKDGLREQRYTEEAAIG